MCGAGVDRRVAISLVVPVFVPVFAPVDGRLRRVRVVRPAGGQRAQLDFERGAGSPESERIRVIVSMVATVSDNGVGQRGRTTGSHRRPASPPPAERRPPHPRSLRRSGEGGPRRPPSPKVSEHGRSESAHRPRVQLPTPAASRQRASKRPRSSASRSDGSFRRRPTMTVATTDGTLRRPRRPKRAHCADLRRSAQISEHLLREQPVSLTVQRPRDRPRRQHPVATPRCHRASRPGGPSTPSSPRAPSDL